MGRISDHQPTAEVSIDGSPTSSTGPCSLVATKATGPGGHRGASHPSSATGSHPHTGSSDQSLPGPATKKPKPALPTASRHIREPDEGVRSACARPFPPMAFRASDGTWQRDRWCSLLPCSRRCGPHALFGEACVGTPGTAGVSQPQRRSALRRLTREAATLGALWRRAQRSPECPAASRTGPPSPGRGSGRGSN